MKKCEATVRQYDPSLHRVSKITTIDRDGHDYNVYTARLRGRARAHTHARKYTHVIRSRINQSVES